MNVIYALVWGVIFGFLANFLTSSSSTILNVFGFGAWIMCGLSFVTLFKMLRG